jgi:hypothetical protein
MQFKEQESNFYHVMAAPRDASFSEIKKAFRMRSIDLHPDKNPSPTAVADFNRLRLAFDVRYLQTNCVFMHVLTRYMHAYVRSLAMRKSARCMTCLARVRC